MTHPLHRPVVAASTLLTLISACTTPGTVPGSASTATSSFSARVIPTNPDEAKGLGQFARYLDQMNMAVVNVNAKRPPLMPLNKSAFATKQDGPEELKSESVSGDDAFLNEMPAEVSPDAVGKETENPDGSVSGTIDEDGDGKTDITFTATKPAEQTGTDGKKHVTRTYTFNNAGETDVFAVDEERDASGNVTGGKMDWTDDKLGKQHVEFSQEEIRLEPTPGMFIVLKPSKPGPDGRVKMVGEIVFDESFASAKQAPGEGKPVQQPMTTQLDYYQYDYVGKPSNSQGPSVGYTTDLWVSTAARMWCIDNETGLPNGDIWQRIGWTFRQDWCEIKNVGRPWANEWRTKRGEKTLRRWPGPFSHISTANPSLRIACTLISGNKAQDAANLVMNMPDGSERRVKLPAKGDASAQLIDKNP